MLWNPLSALSRASPCIDRRVEAGAGVQRIQCLDSEHPKAETCVETGTKLFQQLITVSPRSPRYCIQMFSMPAHGSTGVRATDQAPSGTPWKHGRYMSSQPKPPGSLATQSKLRHPFTSRAPAPRSVVFATRSGKVTAEAAYAQWLTCQQFPETLFSQNKPVKRLTKAWACWNGQEAWSHRAYL